MLKTQLELPNVAMPLTAGTQVMLTIPSNYF